MAEVKVRIALAVDPDGKWSAQGWPTFESDDWDFVVDDLEQGEARYWITAEVDVPERAVAEVEGEVSDAAHGEEGATRGG